MLALMLFSELSCSLLGLCTNWFPPAEIIGFWEMMGISTSLLFATLSFRSLRQGRILTSDASSPDPASSQHRECYENAFRRLASTPEQGWKALFEELTDDERQRIKDIMEQKCFKIDPDGKQPEV